MLGGLQFRGAGVGAVWATVWAAGDARAHCFKIAGRVLGHALWVLVQVLFWCGVWDAV